MPTRAVLDACVLVPISLCDVLLELADDGLFLPLWSQTILAETKNALVGKRGVPVAKAERRIEQMRSAQPEAAVTGFEALIADMGNHPNDQHVLTAAIHRACPVIVTANLVDFPAHALMPHGVTAIRSDTATVGEDRWRCPGGVLVQYFAGHLVWVGSAGFVGVGPDCSFVDLVLDRQRTGGGPGGVLGDHRGCFGRVQKRLRSRNCGHTPAPRVLHRRVETIRLTPRNWL
jgi:hypothetical protein